MSTFGTHPAGDYRAVVDATTQLIDVRAPDEVADRSLPGVVNIPLDELPSRAAELDADRRVVVICRSGRRSATAAQLLVDAGFNDVINLDGGMLAVADAS